MKNSIFKVVGETPEGRFVVSGVFNFFNTYGLPLDIIIEFLWKEGFVPSWEEFYKEAAKAGVGHPSTMIRINDSVRLMKRLNLTTL